MERKIVELVAAGHTNREVAEALFVSVKTVEWNLAKIYRKLGVRSRTELAAKLAGTARSELDVRAGKSGDFPGCSRAASGVCSIAVERYMVERYLPGITRIPAEEAGSILPNDVGGRKSCVDSHSS